MVPSISSIRATSSGPAVTPEPGDVAYYAKIDRRAVQARVQVFHDKDALACGWNVFAKLLTLTLPGKEDLEVRLKVADVDDAQVFLEHDAAVGECRGFADPEAQHDAARR